jgi:multimeric flavodoxin WrbA
MKVVCISASNIEVARGRSASVYACELVREILLTAQPQGLDVEIVPLIDYEPVPCRMCGCCFDDLRCIHDEAFNQVFEKMVSADALFLVSPHYAPIPSKLVILFEKLEEMVYLRTTEDPHFRFPLYRKPVGIIGHGGQTEEALTYYKSALLDPIATVLTSVQMQVVGANEKWPYGVAFGVKDISKIEGSIFVKIDHDWNAVRQLITPLVHNVLERARRVQ